MSEEADYQDLIKLLKRVDTSFYETFFNLIQEGIFIIGPGKKVVFWNKEAEEIAGYTSEDIVGKNCSEDLLIHVDEK